MIILRAGGVEAGRLEMNLVTLASNAVSMSVPAGVAVAEGYTYSRYRRLGASRAVAPIPRFLFFGPVRFATGSSIRGPRRETPSRSISSASARRY